MSSKLWNGDEFLTAAEKEQRDARRLQELQVLDAELSSAKKQSFYENPAGLGTVFFRASDPAKLKAETKKEIRSVSRIHNLTSRISKASFNTLHCCPIAESLKTI